jgi:hypothetical protein
MLRDDKKARQRLLAPKFFTEDGLGAEAVVSRSTGRGVAQAVAAFHG